MSIDCSQLEQSLLTAPAANEDVAHLRQHAKAFIHAVDAQERLHTEAVFPLPLGAWNLAVILQPANLVLKLSPWNDAFEAEFLQLAASTGAAVPQYFGYGSVPDERLPNASYVLMEHIADCCAAGPLFEQNALSEAEITAIARVMGATLAKLHQRTFPHLRHFNDITVNWGQCLGLWNLAQTPLFDAPLLTRFTRILEQTRYREHRQGTLIHSDANPYNILIDAQTHRFRALIDPGPIIIGLPMFDLAYAAQPWRYGRIYQRAMVAAYQAAGGAIDAPLFYTSLLCVAYQQSHYHTPDIPGVRAFIQSDILPHFA